MLKPAIILRRALFLLLSAVCYLGLHHATPSDVCAQRPDSKLELEQMAVTLAKNQREIIRGRYVIPPEDLFANTAFVVVDRGNPNGEAVVRGIAYFLKYPTVGDLLTGKLIRNEAKQQDLLVTLKSSGRRARFRVFQLDPNKEIGRYPLHLDASDYRKWPQELPVLGAIDVDISKDAACLHKELSVVSRDRNLELTVRRERADRTACEPLTMKFYLDSLMWSGEFLASSSYRSGGRAGRLELVKTPLRLPTVEEQYRYLRTTGRELPNWAYVLTDYPEQAGATPRTIWFGYAGARSITSRDVLAGSVAWDATSQSGYVVTVTSAASEAVVRVYRVDLTATASAHPFELNRNEYQKWPKDASPLAQKSIDLSGCQLNSVNASLAKDELVISLGRVEGGCASTRLGLNLKTSQWTELK